MSFEQHLAECGLIAILRGITPVEAVEVGGVLFDAGIRVVEVPLNSPDPFASIAKLAAAFAGRMTVGAGTVLDPADINLLKTHHGEIAVSPDCNPAVIARAKDAGLVPIPGVFTPTEAFAAVRAGATHLKLFPAEAASPATVKAWKAVLPRHVKLFAVGGITPGNMQDWAAAGADGFGIGSNIYKRSMSTGEIGKAASAFVEAWRGIKRNGS